MISVATYHSEKFRVEHGWQCPDCYGVNVTTRRNRNEDGVRGFTCEECGCQFGSK